MSIFELPNITKIRVKVRVKIRLLQNYVKYDMILYKFCVTKYGKQYFLTKH